SRTHPDGKARRGLDRGRPDARLRGLHRRRQKPARRVHEPRTRTWTAPAPRNHPRFAAMPRMQRQRPNRKRPRRPRPLPHLQNTKEQPVNDRTPPHDEHAEMAVLGGMLMSRTAIEEVTGMLAASSFYLPKHEHVYDAITAVESRDEPVDAVTVAAELTRRGELAKIGGPVYLHDLMGSVPTAANAGYYAEIVREHAVRRRLIEIGTRYVQMGYDTTDHADIPEMIDRAQAMAMTLEHIDYEEEDLLLADAYVEVLESVEHGTSQGLPTGLRDFDALTGGLHPGQLIVVAARPALGKSVLAENWVRHTAIATGRPAAMFSLEMSRFEVAKRAIAAEAAVPLHHLAHGRMEESDWDRVKQRTHTIPAAPLYVDENPTLTITSIRSKARRLRRKHGIELLAVDYLQLMEGEA